MRVSDVSLSALNSFGQALSATAHNLANVNTPGFKRLQTDYQSVDGGGVSVTLRRDTTPGAPYQDASGQEMETSNVDLATEAVDLMSIRTAYAANLKPIRAEQEMTGSLLDIMG